MVGISMRNPRPRPAGTPRGFLELAMGSALTALSLVLHLFKFPYPPAPFLKFDGMGIPLAVLALYSLRASIAAQPVVFIGLQLLGADFIGAGMKVAAELSTFVPLAAMYKVICLRRDGRFCSWIVIIGMLCRAAVMSLLNYLIAPHWMVMAYGWAFERAYAVTIALLPHIAVFNLIAAGYVGALALGVFRVVSKTLGTVGPKSS